MNYNSTRHNVYKRAPSISSYSESSLDCFNHLNLWFVPFLDMPSSVIKHGWGMSERNFQSPLKQGMIELNRDYPSYDYWHQSQRVDLFLWSFSILFPSHRPGEHPLYPDWARAVGKWPAPTKWPSEGWSFGGCCHETWGDLFFWSQILIHDIHGDSIWSIYIIL